MVSLAGLRQDFTVFPTFYCTQMSHSVCVCVCPSDDSSGYGPVFEEQPFDTIYPEESQEDKIIMSCRAQASPPATYK